MKKDNRGLSLIELIVVIAIMTVLIGMVGFSLSMLMGAEAKRSAHNMSSQLNDAKTGAMTRAGEVLYLYYIDEANTDSKSGAASRGVDSAGFYTDKSISTILNKTEIKTDFDDHEYSKIGTKKANIMVTAGGKTYLVKSDSVPSDVSGYDQVVEAIRIEYNRRTGEIEEVAIGPKPSGTNGATYASFTQVGEIDEMTFTSGVRTYKLVFDAPIGTHVLE